MGGQEHELSAEQIAEAIRQMKVSDLMLSTVTTLAQVGAAKLEESTRDLAQAQLAIEGIAVLIPKLEGHVADDAQRALRSMLSELQLAYAAAAAAKPNGGSQA